MLQIQTLKNRICIATMCSHWRSISDRYDVPVELDFFCQSANMEGEQGKKVMKQAEKLVASKDVKVLHGPFNELFPAAIDSQARQLAMIRMNQAAEIAMHLNIKKMVVHSGYMPFTYFKEWHVARSIEFWKEFLEDKPDDFEICIENVLDDEPYMLKEIVEGIGDSRAGVCYDSGHANITGKGGFDGKDETTDQSEWMNVLAPYMKHLHLHNNDTKRDYHRDFEDGTIDMMKLLEDVAAKCPENTTITAETLDGQASFRWLKEKELI